MTFLTLRRGRKFRTESYNLTDSPQHYFDALDSFVNEQKLDKILLLGFKKCQKCKKKPYINVLMTKFGQHLSKNNSNKRRYSKL